MRRAVIFDLVGTLFSLQPLERKLRPPALEAWFERLLHTAASLTLAGRFEAFPDAEEALARLERARVLAGVLTNSGERQARELLEAAGLEERVAEIVSAEEIELYKPHPAVYRHAA